MTNNNGGSHQSDAVLVAGAGIGGMQSALLLAEAGRKVYLLDNAPGIGGSMHLLDLTFPTDSCGLCLMMPGRPSHCPTIECDLHRNIEILPYAEVVSVDGEPGQFTVTVRRKPRHVRVDLCTNCGMCAPVCPVVRPDQYEGDLDPQKAIYRPPLRAIPPAYVIDMDYCTRCGKCVEVCPTHAVELEMAESQSELNVGAVILNPGFEPFDARVRGEYGFGYYDNVVTSIQFERMVSTPGSTGAAIVRPSDGRTPKRVAFIQCVGSRDESIGRGYCSSVCCMYTAKQVAAAKRIEPDLDVTVFFMDIRAHGKDFDEYFNSVEALPGVRYRRSIVSSTHQYQQTRDLSLAYVTEDGNLEEEDFDLVVLSVGLAPPLGAQQLAEAAGIELNRYGFSVADRFSPCASTRPGVFVGGAFNEPKDIPETVAEASAVAANAARLVGKTSDAPVSETASEDEVGRDVSGEWPRVGVFLCNCRGEIGDAVDLNQVADFARELRQVAHVEVLDNACLGGGRSQIERAALDHALNRVVVAGCSARLYQRAFERLMRGAKLNPSLLERVNLRGECAWAFPPTGDGDRSVATDKAKRLVEVAAASVRLAEPVAPMEQEPSQRALVIGAGPAGMTAALSLAEVGHEVDLVERSQRLGGNLWRVRTLVDWETAEPEDGETQNSAGSPPVGAPTKLVWRDPQAFLEQLVEKVESNPRIHTRTGARVEAISGWAGQFETTLGPFRRANEPEEQWEETLQHGAVIVATGGRAVRPDEYLYGQDARVLTQLDLDTRLIEGGDVPADVVMIQCVGSREPDRPYCSRVCCTKAVTNALKIKDRDPQARVFVLYREMRTYGFQEDLYREARDRGVIFMRFELPDRPQVSENDEGLEIRVKECITGEEVVIRAGMLVLSIGIKANDNEALADSLDLPLDSNGFFQEEYSKMRPLDFTRRGIFMAGLAHSPCFSDEAIVQGQAAAMRAAALMAQKRLAAATTLVEVDPYFCAACGQCVEVCPFGARVMEPGAPYAEVIDVLCQGCGTCVVACPNKTVEPLSQTPAQMLAMSDVLTG